MGEGVLVALFVKASWFESRLGLMLRVIHPCAIGLVSPHCGPMNKAEMLHLFLKLSLKNEAQAALYFELVNLCPCHLPVPVRSPAKPLFVFKVLALRVVSVVCPPALSHSAPIRLRLLSVTLAANMPEQPGAMKASRISS